MGGIARLVGEFIDRLELREVTVVGNDTGGALVPLDQPARLAEVVGHFMHTSDRDGH
jgi:hypothetical protein